MRLPRPAHVAHLIRRFAGSLWPAGPSAADEAWAEAQLLVGERGLWRRMSGADRRHGLGVARRADALLGGTGRPVRAAALLHDVGKVDAGLGTFARSAATVCGMAVGHHEARIRSWAVLGGWRGRVGRYLLHADIGAGLLARAGSDPLTVAWAREHHLPPAAWTVPMAVGLALKDADDD